MFLFSFLLLLLLNFKSIYTIIWYLVFLKAFFARIFFSRLIFVWKTTHYYVFYAGGDQDVRRLAGLSGPVGRKLPVAVERGGGAESIRLFSFGSY